MKTPIPPLIKELQTIILEKRTEQNKSQRDVIKGTGLSQSIMNAIENHTRKDIQLMTLVKIAEALGTTAIDLIKGAEIRVKKGRN